MGNKNRGKYEFGDFRLDVETDTLWKGEELISVSPKAFELLKLLVSSSGKIVSKEEIFETVWKDTFVENGVLTQNIYTLRNALGKDENDKHIIENIARRGYRISIPITDLSDEIDSNEKSNTHKNATKVSNKTNSYKYVFAIIFAVVLFSLFGFLYYKFNTQESDKNTKFEQLEFQRLTDKGDVNFLHISPDGNWLAYSNSDGIFLKDINANSEVKLNVLNFKDIGFVQFSNDGNSLYFRSPEASYISGNVYQTSRLGGNSKLIAENVWSGFSPSPDGKYMAFVRVKPKENEHILIIKDLENGKEKEISKKTQPLMFYPRNFPAWSSDSKKIVSVVFTRTEHFAELIVNDIETGKEEKIETQKFQNVEQVVWSADGKSFIASANAGKNFQLWKISYPGGKATRITNDLSEYLGISITADGKKLLARQRKYFSNIWNGNIDKPDSFQSLTEGSSRNEGLKGFIWIGKDKIVYSANYKKLRDWNLWSIDLSNNSRQQITSDDGVQNEYPTVSPDGKWIFYSSNRGELADIYRIGIDGEKPKQVTFDKDESELFPQISPDSNWLYFIKKGKNTSAVWRKSLVSEKEEKITKENELSPANFLSISPDGKYLAFQNITQETNNQKAKGFFKVCIISTDNPFEKRFFEIKSSRPIASFSNDGKALEYTKNDKDGSTIWRQEINENTEPKPILKEKNVRIFYFSHSEDGQNLALSKGNLIRDAVVLTGLD